MSLFLEIRLAPIEVIESARDLARDLDMGHLVFAHRHVCRLVDQDVRALQQRVAQEPISGEILLLELFLLVFISRHALKPRQGREHGQQQMQFRVLDDPRLYEQGRQLRTYTHRQPVDRHIPDAAPDQCGAFVFGSERMPIGNEEKALVFALEAYPILEHAMIMPEMQLPGRPHAGEYTFSHVE